VLAFAVAPAFAQSTQSSQTQGKTQSKAEMSSTMKADQAFVTKAAQGGMAEVELGKLAQQKASSPEVKNFAQRMVDDHSKANDELKSIAEKKNITIPTAIDSKDKAEYNRLSKLSGTAFDRAYMDAMLKDHRTDVSEFQYEARAGQDADVRGFASKTLPTLQEHLKQAESTNSAVATSGVKDNKGTNVKKPATGTTGTRGSGTTNGTGTTGASGTNPSTGTNPR
jgi:putative membrane protein